MRDSASPPAQQAQVSTGCGARPGIAVPAGLAQRHARREDARAAHEALLDRFGEPAIGPGGIADSREAALQHAFEHLGRLQGQQGDRPIRQPGESRVDGEHMDMRIDQPRHQRAACEIDRLGRGAVDRPVGDFADRPSSTST